MRWYESGTGHIRCSICRASLLGGRLRTVQRNRQSPPSSLQARLQARLKRAGHQVDHAVTLQPTFRRAIYPAPRPDYHRAFRPDHTGKQRPFLTSTTSSHSEATPYPDAHAPLVGAVNLSKLSWSVDPPKPSALVSSKACPGKGCCHGRAHARESVTMAVKTYAQEVPAPPPVAGM